MELEIPVMPVPVFDGASQQFWSSYEADLMQMLRIAVRFCYRAGTCGCW
jgi:hypothetical protein